MHQPGVFSGGWCLGVLVGAYHQPQNFFFFAVRRSWLRQRECCRPRKLRSHFCIIFPPSVHECMPYIMGYIHLYECVLRGFEFCIYTSAIICNSAAQLTHFSLCVFVFVLACVTRPAWGRSSRCSCLASASSSSPSQFVSLCCLCNIYNYNHIFHSHCRTMLITLATHSAALLHRAAQP